MPGVPKAASGASTEGSPGGASARWADQMGRGSVTGLGTWISAPPANTHGIVLGRHGNGCRRGSGGQWNAVRGPTSMPLISTQLSRRARGRGEDGSEPLVHSTLSSPSPQLPGLHGEPVSDLPRGSPVSRGTSWSHSGCWLARSSTATASFLKIYIPNIIVILID